MVGWSLRLRKPNGGQHFPNGLVILDTMMYIKIKCPPQKPPQQIQEKTKWLPGLWCFDDLGQPFFTRELDHGIMVSLKAYKKKLPAAFMDSNGWCCPWFLLVLILFPSDDSGRSIHTMCKPGFTYEFDQMCSLGTFQVGEKQQKDPTKNRVTLMILEVNQLSHTIHVWYTYLHSVDFLW